MTTKQRLFIRQLRDLLMNYGAEIGCTCSDMCGLYQDHLFISMIGQKDIDLPFGIIDVVELAKLLERDEKGDVEDDNK